MDQEMITYILSYSANLMTADEAAAWRHYGTLFKADKKDISEFSEKRRKIYLKHGWITDKPKVLNLLKDGLKRFQENTARRILADHGAQVVFNYCPKCDKLTRTPRAKQCRFCGHDWH